MPSLNECNKFMVKISFMIVILYVVKPYIFLSNTLRAYSPPDHNRVGMQVVATAVGLRLSTNLVTPLMQWSAFCVSISQAEPVSIYFNGESVKVSAWDRRKKRMGERKR